MYICKNVVALPFDLHGCMGQPSSGVARNNFLEGLFFFMLGSLHKK